MSARFTITGDDVVIKELLKRANGAKFFDKIAEQSMRNIQQDAFNRAPVDTGFLQENLLTDDNRVRTPDTELGSFDLIDGTEYTLVQEYEHRNKSAFIRNSVAVEEPEFHREVERLAKDGKW